MNEITAQLTAWLLGLVAAERWQHWLSKAAHHGHCWLTWYDVHHQATQAAALARWE